MQMLSTERCSQDVSKCCVCVYSLSVCGSTVQRFGESKHIKAFVDTGHYVCGIFDLEKAFDTVNHKILCEKLNYYGLRGNVNKLIQSYLANRRQYV